MAKGPPPGATSGSVMSDFNFHSAEVPSMFTHLPPSEARAKMKELQEAQEAIRGNEMANRLRQEIEAKIMEKLQTHAEFTDEGFSEIMIWINSLNNDDVKLQLIKKTEIQLVIKGQKVKITPL